MYNFAPKNSGAYESKQIQGVALPQKSGLDKQGKAPIMGRITLNNSMAQFSCKLSCNPKLWNSCSGRLDGKSKEAVETNAKIERILLSVNSAVDNLTKRNV